MRDEQRRHLRVIHSNPEPITGNAGLRYLKYRATDSVPVSNADFIVRQTIDSKILSELPVLKVIPPELALPISIGLDLIDHQGALFAAMTLKICLAISIQIQAPNKDAIRHGAFPDCGTDEFALPFNFARKTNIDRQEFRHWTLVWVIQ
jgi:hypothetical protein